MRVTQFLRPKIAGLKSFDRLRQRKALFRRQEFMFWENDPFQLCRTTPISHFASIFSERIPKGFRVSYVRGSAGTFSRERQQRVRVKKIPADVALDEFETSRCDPSQHSHQGPFFIVGRKQHRYHRRNPKSRGAAAIGRHESYPHRLARLRRSPRRFGLVARRKRATSRRLPRGQRGRSPGRGFSPPTDLIQVPAPSALERRVSLLHFARP